MDVNVTPILLQRISNCEFIKKKKNNWIHYQSLVCRDKMFLSSTQTRKLKSIEFIQRFRNWIDRCEPLRYDQYTPMAEMMALLFHWIIKSYLIDLCQDLYCSTDVRSKCYLFSNYYWLIFSFIANIVILRGLWQLYAVIFDEFWGWYHDWAIHL